MTGITKTNIYINKKYIDKNLDMLQHQVFNNYDHSKLSIYLEMLNNLKNPQLNLDNNSLLRIKDIDKEIKRINKPKTPTSQNKHKNKIK